MKLREVKIEDANFLFKTKQDKEFQKYLPDMLIPKTLKEEEKEIKDAIRLSKKEQWFYFILEEKNERIGYVDIYKINKKHKRCSVGYGIAKKHCNKGYATKALKLALTKIIELKLHTIEATTNPKNIVSQRVLLNNGFTKIGLMKDYYYSKGKYIDRILYWKVI